MERRNNEFSLEQEEIEEQKDIQVKSVVGFMFLKLRGILEL